MSELQDLAHDLAADVAKSASERLDYELRGAWRAGYDYLHVYGSIECSGVEMDAFSVRRGYLATDVREPSSHGSYLHTYCLGDVDDDEILEALRR